MRTISKGLMTLATVGIGTMMMAGCTDGGSTGGSAEAVTPESVVGTWTLESGSGPNGDIKPVETAPITMTVAADGQVSGTAGCNNLNSQIAVAAEGAVTFGLAATTLMACEEDVMAAEYAYTTSLEAVTKGELRDNKLVLTGEGVELTFAQS